MFLPRALVRHLPGRVSDLLTWCLAKPSPDSLPLTTQPAAVADLFARWGDDILGRLEMIHEAPDPGDVQNRFLIVELVDRPQCYVQCAFGVRDRWMVCEVASGVFFDEPRTMFLPAPAIAALGRLGFATNEPEENYRQAFRLADPPDLWAVTLLLLNGLHAGFGVTAEDALRFTAPYTGEG